MTALYLPAVARGAKSAPAADVGGSAFLKMLADTSQPAADTSAASVTPAVDTSGPAADTSAATPSADNIAVVCRVRHA